MIITYEVDGAHVFCPEDRVPRSVRSQLTPARPSGAALPETTVDREKQALPEFLPRPQQTRPQSDLPYQELS